jgi:outer membrane murein-binding lipoprotein Lpp
MQFTINHVIQLSPALESFLMSTISDLDQKVDALKASTDAKIGELITGVKAFSDQVADLNTKITDPAAVDALAAKLDANKAAVDGVTVTPAPPAS